MNKFKKNKQRKSIIFKSNDDLLYSMSNRTIDKGLFDYEKNIITKKEPINKLENKIAENISSQLFNSNSGDFSTPSSIKVKNTEFEQELNKKLLFGSIFSDNCAFSKFEINKKVFTTCLLKDQTLLCKIKKSHVKMMYGKKTTIYHLYTDFKNMFILSCKKISNLTYTEYVFTISDNPINCSNENIIGKVVSKFFGNEYNIYDNSENITINKLIGTIDYVIKDFLIFYV
jgi:hypothetical protein